MTLPSYVGVMLLKNISILVILSIVLFCQPAFSQNPEKSQTILHYDWWVTKRELLGNAPDIIRYVTNECVLAGVAGIVASYMLTTTPAAALGPITQVALGISNEMSVWTIGLLGCTAGAAAGVASIAVIEIYEQPDVFIEEATNNINDIVFNMWNLVSYWLTPTPEKHNHDDFTVIEDIAFIPE